MCVYTRTANSDIAANEPKWIRILSSVAAVVPTDEHGDATAEDVEAGSLLLHQPAASPLERSARVPDGPVAEARVLLLLHLLLS